MQIGKMNKENQNDDFLFTLEEKPPCVDCKYYFNGTTCVFNENPPDGIQVYSNMDDCMCDQWDGVNTSGLFWEACCRKNPGNPSLGTCPP
jgi:hypothetical protein